MSASVGGVLTPRPSILPLWLRVGSLAIYTVYAASDLQDRAEWADYNRNAILVGSKVLHRLRRHK